MFKRPVYVWQLPIRVWHWLNFLCITILLLTGLYIGDPPFSLSGEAYSTFLMGYTRIVHNFVAWVFIAGFIMRCYWWVAGNEYSRFNPFSPKYWGEVWEVIKHYLFIKRKVTPHAGHSALAHLSYLVFIGLGGFCMIVTGLALQAETLPNSIRAKLFSWLVPFFGSSFNLRSVHHIIAWFILTFVILHLYMAFRQDVLQGDSSVSSIINGYKYLPVEVAEHDEK